MRKVNAFYSQDINNALMFNSKNGDLIVKCYIIHKRKTL